VARGATVLTRESLIFVRRVRPAESSWPASLARRSIAPIANVTGSACYLIAWLQTFYFLRPFRAAVTNGDRRHVANLIAMRSPFEAMNFGAPEIFDVAFVGDLISLGRGVLIAGQEDPFTLFEALCDHPEARGLRSMAVTTTPIEIASGDRRAATVIPYHRVCMPECLPVGKNSVELIDLLREDADYVDLGAEGDFRHAVRFTDLAALRIGRVHADSRVGTLPLALQQRYNLDVIYHSDANSTDEFRLVGLHLRIGGSVNSGHYVAVLRRGFEW
jgi:hypothetical protein